MAATTLLTLSSRLFNTGAFTSSNFVLPSNPFEVIRITLTPSGSVAGNFSMSIGFFVQDGISFTPVASVTADSGFATGGVQFLQFPGQQYVGRTMQVQLSLNSPVTMAILIQGGSAIDLPRS